VIDIEKAGAKRIQIKGDWLAAGEGGIWLATDGPGCTGCRVARVDPQSMKVTASIRVQAGAATVRTGEGAVGVANPLEDVVQQIDPEAEKVIRTVKTGSLPRFFDVGEGAVWTLNQRRGRRPDRRRRFGLGPRHLEAPGSHRPAAQSRGRTLRARGWKRRGHRRPGGGLDLRA
jgi:hypothetical protein